MDDLKKIAQQFAAAANVAGPSSYIPEVQAFAQAGSIEDAVKRGIGAGSVVAGQKAKEADAADEAARKAAAARIAQKMDPKNFQKVRKADGGFAFYDPDGKEISINDYASVTGLRRAEILADSENPIDQEYINDYKNMNDLAQAFYNGDQATIKSFTDANPELAGRKPADLMSELIRKYPHMYGRGGAGGAAYQQTLKNRGMQIFNPGALAGYGTGAGSGGGWSPS